MPTGEQIRNYDKKLTVQGRKGERIKQHVGPGSNDM